MPASADVLLRCLRRRLRTSIGVGVAGLTLAGCAGAPGGSTPTPTEPPTAPVSGSTAGAPSSTAPEAPPVPSRTINLTYANGEVSGDTGRTRAALGDQVTINVTSDTPEEVHLHGYDKRIAVVPGTTAAMQVTADIPGVFELELEQAGRELTKLEVR